MDRIFTHVASWIAGRAGQPATFLFAALEQEQADNDIGRSSIAGGSVERLLRRYQAEAISAFNDAGRLSQSVPAGRCYPIRRMQPSECDHIRDHI